MSFVKKIKDILFEEEETEEIKIVPKKEVNVEPEKPVVTFHEETPVKEAKQEPSERELFKQDNSFKFPDFDEDEFESSYKRVQPKSNVLDYEKKKMMDKRNDYNRVDRSRYEKVEVKDINDRKKFKPSPIISPVYGVLNKDYTPDDVVNKDEVASNIDIDAVRKKAFETPIMKEEVELPRKTIDEIVDEPVVTFFEEKENNKVEETIDEIEFIPQTSNLDAIEEELEKIDNEKVVEKEETIDDELDNDLFDLIDSMYDEGGEEN